MKTIHKYVLDVLSEQTIEMLAGAEILCLQVQHGKPCIWALVDVNAPKTERTFRIIGTGHDFSDHGACQYIDTFQMQTGVLVFHVFEKLRD